MEFLYSITVYKCGVYNIPEKLQMITTYSAYYGTDLVFPVYFESGFSVNAKHAQLERRSAHQLRLKAVDMLQSST